MPYFVKTKNKLISYLRCFSHLYFKYYHYCLESFTWFRTIRADTNSAFLVQYLSIVVYKSLYPSSPPSSVSFDQSWSPTGKTSGDVARCLTTETRLAEFGALYNGLRSASYSLIPSPFFLILRKEFTMKPLSDGLVFWTWARSLGRLETRFCPDCCPKIAVHSMVGPPRRPLEPNVSVFVNFWFTHIFSKTDHKGSCFLISVKLLLIV